MRCMFGVRIGMGLGLVLGIGFARCVGFGFGVGVMIRSWVESGIAGFGVVRWDTGWGYDWDSDLD